MIQMRTNFILRKTIHSGQVFRSGFLYSKIIFYFAILWGEISPLKAQFYIQEGRVSILENSKVTVEGDLNNSGHIIQEGTLAVNGNWKNKSTYSSKQGTVILSGTGKQDFDHNNQKVYNMFLVNGGNIRLLSNLEIEGKLKLEKGIITPVSSVHLVLAESAGIEGGSLDAHINGSLYHTGIGNKFYPIGKNGQYAPVTLTQISGNEPVVGMEFYDNGLLNSPEDPLQWLGNGFYWQLTHLSGDFEGSPINLNIIANDFPAETDQLIIAVSNNLSQGFGTLAEGNFQTQGNWYSISSSIPVQNPYITIGLKNTEKNILYIPNVLSPLATNQEDRSVKIYSEKVVSEGFLWVIRDQWGHVVYTTNSYAEASTKGWQGIVQKGNPALPGIYHYIIKGKFENGDPFSKKGNLVLIK